MLKDFRSIFFRISLFFLDDYPETAGEIIKEVKDIKFGSTTLGYQKSGIGFSLTK